MSTETSDRKKIFFYQLTTITGAVYSDFWIGEDPDEILKSVIKRMPKLQEFDLRVKASRPLTDFQEFVPQQPKTIVKKEQLPEAQIKRLKKQTFVNNLLYTRDYLVKDEKDRKALTRILNKIGI